MFPRGGVGRWPTCPGLTCPGPSGRQTDPASRIETTFTAGHFKTRTQRVRTGQPGVNPPQAGVTPGTGIVPSIPRPGRVQLKPRQGHPEFPPRATVGSGGAPFSPNPVRGGRRFHQFPLCFSGHPFLPPRKTRSCPDMGRSMNDPFPRFARESTSCLAF